MFRAACMALTLAVASCGGGEDRTKAQVRLVNASAYPQLDLRVHDERRQESVTYGNTAGYVEVDPGKADTQITNAGSATALVSFTPSVSARKHYAMLAYGPLGALKYVQLDEDQGEPDNNKTLVRVVNAAADAGALDVYLTAADEALTSVVPVESAAAYGTLGSFRTVDSRSWQLRVTAAGSKTDLRLSVPALALGSRQVATLVLTPGTGGVLVNALLVVQQSSLTRQDGAHARVRAAAGVTDNAAVSVKLGTVDLLSGIASVAVGNYALVPAGAQPLTVTVSGAAIATPAQTLAVGSNYTVMVYGTPAAPLAVLIRDDDAVPTDTTMATVRLVNGITGLTSPASLTVDGIPVGTGVVAGAATSYVSVTATTTADVNVTSSGVGTLCCDGDRTLTGGGSYSVFVMGSTTAPRGVLRRDR